MVDVVSAYRQAFYRFVFLFKSMKLVLMSCLKLWYGSLTDRPSGEGHVASATATALYMILPEHRNSLTLRVVLKDTRTGAVPPVSGDGFEHEMHAKLSWRDTEAKNSASRNQLLGLHSRSFSGEEWGPRVRP